MSAITPEAAERAGDAAQIAVFRSADRAEEAINLALAGVYYSLAHLQRQLAATERQLADLDRLLAREPRRLAA
ncbi:hypothetical protein HMF7854_04305 [Sphingomonas ginkgonis]|uniref:Uncharacterized protein n=1 Tax=Sphingomonas ginkgonis TaxID=2315330 RepID=A0A3R9X6Q0_9SPHN|nr:hypothetical protein [Sphingomonas ginkgonis]RST30132.1 hypothetical protein HMF7854_04305 [Sphingomonas ginkgonis]